MIEADPEYYRSLQKDLTRQGRWFALGYIGLLVCVALAVGKGPADGWSWLVYSLVFLLCALWARIDQQTTTLLIQIYLANAK